MSSQESSESAPVQLADEAVAPDSPPQGPSFPVVGVGASAGGIESFTELLRALPPAPGLALLYVTHLGPHRKSELPQVLGHATLMPVNEVSEGMHVECDHVYIIPPNTNMALTDGKLTLTPRSPVPGHHMPCDYLFRSLAAIQKNRAIAVILSGGGSDGTLGFEAIKAEGGITFAQDDRTAQQPSMPRSAILEGNVDYVLPPVQIARQLARLARHPYNHTAVDETAAAVDVTAEILALLRSVTQVDFTHYKTSTINRRLLRRAALRECDRLEHYLELLRRDRGELNHLYQDLLIRVTQFFRDPEAFQVLKEQVFESLVKGRTAAQPIRIWAAGCSTGEEAYSLAMALLEFLDNRHDGLSIKILATDLNETAIEKARAGVYLDNIAADVSPERLRRYFNRLDNGYQISKSVRELCVFSRHDMTRDPPFGHLDLVACRNVLIYMNASLQKRVLPLLHYALNPGGYLFLGSSESLGPSEGLFTPVDVRHRIFVKRAIAPGRPAPAGFEPFVRDTPPPPLRREERGTSWSALDVQREADRLVLGRYAPVGVVIDESMTVVQFRGRTVPYLEPAPGTATLDLFRMLREGLLAEVRAAIGEARAQDAVVSRMALHADGEPVRVEVIPFKVPGVEVRFFLVLFDHSQREPPTTPAMPDRPVSDGQVAHLQQELTAVRHYVQSVIEERESTTEELKAANEEILSANEELQSTNEELQTAKEEAQSANEELKTVNEELHHRNVELARVNDDLVNLLSGVGIPIVLVGRDLRIRRFTPPAELLFRLIPTDVGRPIRDIKPNLNVPDLSALIAGVIDSLTSHQSEVKDADGNVYCLRVRPYVTADKVIDGASVILLEVDPLHSGERKSET